MSKPLNIKLYNEVKKEADKIYEKHSAYKSGWIVKTYKEKGGKYEGTKKSNKGLDRWYKEEWKDIAGLEYPVYRPTKRITKDTPLTADEISNKSAVKQSILKQKIKGSKNLPAFEGKITKKGIRVKKRKERTQRKKKTKRRGGGHDHEDLPHYHLLIKFPHGTVKEMSELFEGSELIRNVQSATINDIKKFVISEGYPEGTFTLFWKGKKMVDSSIKLRKIVVDEVKLPLYRPNINDVIVVKLNDEIGDPVNFESHDIDWQSKRPETPRYK